jgi:hypothetical protein
LTLTKYNDETKLELWIVDFRLACQLGGTTDDKVIIRQLPLFLSDTARAWLEDLPPRQIHDWDDLVRVFEGNFKGTYMRLGNSWDLRSCKQKPDESLRDYIRRFSKQRTELPNIIGSDVIMALLSRTTCKELARELGHNTPTTANELMDIITNYVAGEEAIGAIFGGNQDKGKHKNEEPESSNRGARKNNNLVVTDDLVAAANRKKPRGPPDGGIFDKMLKESCPYHKGPTNHNLEDCHMLRRYFESLGIKDDKKEDPKEKGDDKDEGFPEIHDCFMIYGGSLTRLSVHQRKWEHREVFFVCLATPLFLDWSDIAINFDRDDHPDYDPNPRVYPIVVDPIIANTRLTKVLMDGGNSLNIIYTRTLDLLGIERMYL